MCAPTIYIHDYFTLACNVIASGPVRLILRWEGLKGVEEDFDLQGIESLSILSNPLRFGIKRTSPKGEIDTATSSI